MTPAEPTAARGDPSTSDGAGGLRHAATADPHVRPYDESQKTLSARARTGHRRSVQRQARAIAVGSALCAAAAVALARVVITGERTRTARAAQRHHDTVVAHERLVQDLVAAKWAIEAGHSERGLEIVTNALNQVQDVVWQMRQKE